MKKQSQIQQLKNNLPALTPQQQLATKGGWALTCEEKRVNLLFFSYTKDVWRLKYDGKPLSLTVSM